MGKIGKTYALLLTLTVTMSCLSILMVKPAISETLSTSIQESSGLASFTVLASADTDVNGSFGILIFALDSNGSNVKSFTGNVTFSASEGVISPANSGPFSDGFWKGILHVSGISDSDIRDHYLEIFVYVNDGNGHTGRSGLIHVLPLLPSPSARATPTPTVPELSILVVLPLFVVMSLIATKVLRRRSD